jgi:hypothetical protein
LLKVRGGGFKNFKNMILAWNMNNTDKIPSLKIRKLFPFKVNEKYVIHYTCISENLDQSKYYMHKK